MAKKLIKTKLARSTTHSLFLLVTSSHSFSCFSASLQVQQFLLMQKQKTHQKKRNRKQQTNSAIAAEAFFFHPPRCLLPSQPVYFPTLYPTQFTTHPQIYLLPACHTTFLSLCLTHCFFSTYLLTFYYLSF